MKMEAQKETTKQGKNGSVEDLPETQGKAQKTEKNRLDESIVNDVLITLDAFLGSAKMPVSELLVLEDGAVVTLDASLNHRADLRLNGKTIARGEIVAVGDKFGVRITEISDE